MRIYFLLEGRRTEWKVYPKWLSHLIPELSRTLDVFKIKKNQYFMFTGNGWPSLLNNIANSIEEINSIKKFNYFVICIDADDVSVQERESEVHEYIRKYKLSLDKKCKLVVIVQSKCFETWFLGNRDVYTNHPQSPDLIKYIRFFNVKERDPELMKKMAGFNTIAQFHEEYLSEMLRERRISYTKQNPNEVVEQHYLDALIERHNDTQHIKSFKTFLDFCSEVRNYLEYI